MPLGTITRFFKKQGYGYITPDGNDGDYVVVLDEVVSNRFVEFGEGVRVHFEEADDAMGLRASNVVVLEMPETGLLS